ncbi:TlpA family protein disulfide reductase [Paenibacillus sp. SYP-B3998]|uniref:TlpA family protein disulfide reductase n=2 Tax=Paenibacillus sp. SYP-B3998 TaxID=2678564 RepID=A0A6G3ZS56_9BACL|nr:TlpA disulfide reductase family protein [Paenibacillus sp. SYP-B3998]NEW04868.1 TlpA family protein disulfide reductase [Paenibacillus sp. SYP-B3998]
MIICIGLVFYQHPSPSKSTSQPGEGVDIGLKAPDFTLEGLDSQTYRLASFRGKPTIVNFWASWCGPCVDEAPSFAKLHEAYGSQVNIVAINLTTLDSLENVQAFVQRYHFRFPILLDTAGDTAAKYRIQPIPSTFFLDKNGVIVDGMLGALDAQTLKQKTDELLTGT